MATKRKGGRRQGGRGRFWLLSTVGLGAAAVAGFFAVSAFVPKVAPAPRVAEKPAAPAPSGTRYASDDRDKLSRQIASLDPAARRALVPPANVGETTSARKLTSAEWRVIDTAFSDQLRRCWPKIDARGGYVPIIKVEFDPQGSLASKPVLIGAHNPQEIAAGQALADAVSRCGPLQVPAELRPMHAQWKTRTIRLDPPQMSGM